MCNSKRIGPRAQIWSTCHHTHILLFKGHFTSRTVVIVWISGYSCVLKQLCFNAWRHTEDKVHYLQNTFGKKHRHHCFTLDDNLRPAYFVNSTNASLQSKEEQGLKHWTDSGPFIAGSPTDWTCDLRLSPSLSELGFGLTSPRGGKERIRISVYHNYVRFCIPTSQVCSIVKSLKGEDCISLSTTASTV